MNLRLRFRIIVILTIFMQVNVLFAQVPNYVPTNGLVGYWPFSGNANDVSGFGNNGAVNGPILTTDRFGIANKAYDFNPSLYQYININQNQALNNLNQISISTWIFPNSNASYNHMVNKSNDANLHQFVLSSNNNGIYFYFGNGSSYFQSNTSPILNQWNHIVVTYSYGSGSDNCLIYLNGILSGSFVTTVPLQSTNYNLKFGSFGNNSINTVKGKLDDVGIWNRALTECEIQQLYLSQLNPLNVNAGQDQTICSGSSVTLTATGANNYSWTGGIQNGVPFIPTSSSQYIITGTNVSGCSGTDTVNVNVQPAPVISFTNDTICLGQSTTLTASISSNCGNLSGSLTNGLVGYWPFCGNALDISGTGNHGSTLNGVSLTTDRFGFSNNAYNFDGLNDVITVMDNNTLDFPNGQFSLMAWVKVNNLGVEMSFIDHLDNGSPSIFSRYELRRLTNNKVRFILKDMNNISSYIDSDILLDNTSSWFHIVGTFNSSTQTIKLFINGIEQTGTITLQGTGNTITPPGILQFGKYGDQIYSNTHIDDIGIWNRTLTSAEIQQLYTQGQTTLLWSPGGETTTDINVSPATTTNYTCTATTNGVSCSQSQIIEVLQPSSSILNVTECNSYTFNGQNYTQSGVFTEVIPNVAGCDSTITLNLTLNSPPTTPNIYIQNQTTLSTDSIPGLSYQWFFCTDLIDVPGATNPTFTPTANAYYAVVVSNACGSDTSACAEISSTGLNVLGNQNVQLFPNPTKSSISVSVPSHLQGQRWELLDIQGRLVLNGKVEDEYQIIDLGNLASGSFWLRISTLKPLQVIKN